MKSVTEVQVVSGGLKIRFNVSKELIFQNCWLRDHCRCTKCYNANTKQRSAHILDIPETFISTAVCQDGHLFIKWSDDHESTYDVEFLSQFDYEKWSESRRTKPYPWRGTDIVEKVAKVPVNKFLNTDEGAKAVFQSLLSYGVAFIDGVEPTLASTEVVCRAMGGIQHTLFGGMWEIRPEPGVNDTAYMNVGLPQHTDLSSFTEPAGLQVFHCLQHDGTGGESVISDGFYAANKLKESHREDYNFLTTFDAEAEYVFNDHHFRYSAPMIELDNFGDLKQIRFNTYDRSSIAFKNGDQCNAYYQALRNFAKIIEDPKNHWQFKLKPGLVMVFDNFRALHGRTEFTGMRVIAGSYVARTDWLDRARTLKLIK